MNASSTKKHDHADSPAKPIIKKMRWPAAAIWLVPILAALLTGYFLYNRLQERGPQITLRFTDATGLKPGETNIIHLGVPIGQVTAVKLSSDQKQVLVEVSLHRSAASFANKGALYWIVKPEISTQEISGLATVLSGPVIDALPGTGEPQTEFTGLEKRPTPIDDGLAITLKSPHLEHLRADSPLYYRGIQVGLVKDVQLSPDATTIDIHALVKRRFAPLVKANSQFWIVSPVDVKGGIFTGIQMKVESLSSLFFGGIAFATPEENMGPQAENGATFSLNDDAKKEWLAWSPKIDIPPDTTNSEEKKLPLPQTPAAIRSNVAPTN